MMGGDPLSGKRILLGVTGSISAYKAVEIVRGLVQSGGQVVVVMTESATRFVSPLTFEVLSHHPVYTDLFDPRKEIIHLTLAEEVDLILIAPATAHTLGKMAHGLADDLLSTLFLAARVPVIVAPAMDGEMWNHPLVRRNTTLLEESGVRVISPQYGPLASGKSGPGRLPDPSVIISTVREFFSHQEDLRGEVVLVTAGPTQEPLDAVRILTNRSSGRMGYAIAECARDRGARVILISGPVSLPRPPGVEVVEVTTAHEMKKAVLARFEESTILIMAAAVSDYCSRSPSPLKMKKGKTPLVLELVPTPDILEEIAPLRKTQYVVGFAAESDHVRENASEKLKRKNLDLIVLNDVTQEGAGFGRETNVVTLMSKEGDIIDIPLMHKRDVAFRIVEKILSLKRGSLSRGQETGRSS